MWRLSLNIRWAALFKIFSLRALKPPLWTRRNNPKVRTIGPHVCSSSGIFWGARPWWSMWLMSSCGRHFMKGLCVCQVLLEVCRSNEPMLCWSSLRKDWHHESLYRKACCRFLTVDLCHVHLMCHAMATGAKTTEIWVPLGTEIVKKNSFLLWKKKHT